MFSSPSRSAGSDSESDAPRPAAFGAPAAPVDRASRRTETRRAALVRLGDAARGEARVRNDFAAAHDGRQNDVLARQAAAAARAYEVAGADAGPPNEPDGSSDFNTLRAVVTIARRIHDTALLPAHSRTLNNSVLKKLMETTAMLSNRTIKQLYPAYMKDDVSAQELQMVADAQLRRLKADIREYVDRLLDPTTFLETELGASAFTAACSEALTYISQRGGSPHVIGEPGRAPQLEWDGRTAELADVIVRHADVRGNIIDAGQTDIMNRYNWYNSSQHAWGACFPDGAGWSALHDEFAAAETTMSDGAQTEGAKLAAVQALRRKLLQRPFPLAPESGATASWRGAAARGKTPRAGLSADAQWEMMKKETGWDLFIAVKYALDDQADVTTSAPLTLFDIALLGGLHPRTFAMVEKAGESTGDVPAKLGFHFDTDVFFEQCMAYFDALDRGDDLGEVLFSTHLNTKSKHTSFLPFRRDRVAEARNAGTLPPDPGDLDRRRPVEFGAPKKGRRDEEDAPPPASKRLRDAQAKRREDHAPAEQFLISTGQVEILDKYALERYCDTCFERGAELYIRLTRVMIETHLRRVRAYDETNFPPPFLRALAKCIGLTMQRAELMNPALKSTSVSNNRENRRSNSWALVETRVQLAQHCGFKPEVELDGYAFSGPLSGAERAGPAAPPGWVPTPGGPVWNRAYM